MPESPQDLQLLKLATIMKLYHGCVYREQATNKLQNVVKQDIYTGHEDTMLNLYALVHLVKLLRFDRQRATNFHS